MRTVKEFNSIITRRGGDIIFTAQGLKKTNIHTNKIEDIVNDKKNK